MNNVNIIGRVGADIELRHTPSGKAVTEINLAVDDGFGENKKTAWIGVAIWDKAAEIAAQHVRKGDQLGISGRLTQDEWEDKATGKKQRKTKVTCERLWLIGGKRESSPHEHRPPAAQRQYQQPPATQPEEEDDIPF